eukprot:scaffold651694_cov39-Prasinocladus_malaysianus.AAC.1
MACRQCSQACGRPRESCAHPCPRPCHAGACEPCGEAVERPCHCGKTQLHFECHDIAAAKP